MFLEVITSKAEQSDLGSLAEWATATVALVALVLSALALHQAHKSSRRLSFIAFEERLHTHAATAGRREIYQVNSASDVKRLRRRHARWDHANHAINLWNNLAQYAKLGFVEQQLAIDRWGDAVTEAWPHLEHFIRHRRTNARSDKWTSLVWFAKKAGATVSPDIDAL